MDEEASGYLNQMLDKIASLVQRGAIIVILIALAVTALAARYTVEHLAINTSTLDMISEEVPFRRNDMTFRAAFPQFSDPIVALVEGTTPEGAERGAARLEERLRQDAAHVERVARPGSGAYFERTGLLFLEEPELAALADRLATAQPLLAQLAREPNLRGMNAILEQVAAYPEAADRAEVAAILDRMAAVARATAEGLPRMLSWQALFSLEKPSSDGLFRRFILIQPIFEQGAFMPAEPAMNEVQRLAEEEGIVAENGLRLRLTGPAALDHEELTSVEIGGRSAVVLSMVLVSILLVVGLRSWVLVAAALVTLTVGLVWTAGFAALVVGHLNLISVAFAVLFVGLGIDFCLHLCLRYREEAARLRDRRRALRIATVGVGGSLFLSTLSAAAGFYSFLPTAYKGLAELGLIAGSGMFIALVLSLVLLPAILMLLPFGAKRWRVGQASAEGRMLGRLRGHSRPVLLTALALGVAGAATLPSLRFDFNPIHLSDPAMESVSTFLELAADAESGVYTADILAEDLPTSQKLAAELEALPEVGRVLTVESFVPGNQEPKLRIIDDMAIFLGPVLNAPTGTVDLGAGQLRMAYSDLRASILSLATREGEMAGAAEALASALEDIAGNDASEISILERLNRNMAGNLPTTLEGLRTALEAQPVTLDDLPPEVTRLWVAADGRIRIEAYPAEGISSNAEMERFADAVLSVAPTATGVPIVVSRAGAAVVDAFQMASLIALVAITIILLIVLRRITDVALVLAPLVLAAVLTGATAVLLGLSLNFANVIALPLLLGLGVASGIHLVMRGRQEGDEAKVMASSTPRAVLFSALTTVASFGSLALSGHRGMTSMGLLLTIAISWTLIATLIVLPALMERLGRGGSSRT